MCYSATASFSAAALLGAMGVLLLFRINNKKYLPLALLPLLVAIQQAAEGFVWLNINNLFAKDLFLFFAFVLWPLWVPFAFWVPEKSPRRKQALALSFGVGLVISCWLAFIIPQTTAQASHSSIQYISSLRFSPYSIILIFYAFATMLPFFFSSLPKTSLFGMLFVLSALFVGWMDEIHFVSMWCFVSALISLGLFFILKPDLSSKK